jgi:hypothetical protein
MLLRMRRSACAHIAQLMRVTSFETAEGDQTLSDYVAVIS